MRSAIAAWRLVRVLQHALVGLWIITFRFPRLTARQREAQVQAWALGLLRLFGLDLEVHGKPLGEGPALLVANHISWVDILALHAARYCRFVSKADVHHWPLVGRLAAGAGTLFIERASRRDALRVVHHMAESLRAGDVLAVFPEGTTSDGTSMKPFHANLLQAAIAADAPVQPVGLSFVDAATRAPSRVPCYIDDETLVASMWRTLTHPRVVVVVRFGQAQACAGRDRRAWAADLQAAVDALRAG